MTLKDHARQAQRAAYAPYSHYKVGCALATEDGSIYTGCNVENASYGGTVCAERVAILKAVSDGHRKFRTLVVATDATNLAPPCGLCNQTMAEFFDPDLEVILCGANDVEQRYTFGQLLPHPFNQSSLV